MKLDEGQLKKVAEWIKQGLKLSEIQNRISSELGLTVTYMEVRLLVDDLKLTPKDVEPPKTTGSMLATPATSPSHAGPGRHGVDKQQAPGTGSVSVVVDHIARPGAIVSGSVTFSDGNKSAWYLDQTGRLGLVPEQAGYRPPAADLQKFQTALDAELRKMGF